MPSRSKPPCSQTSVKPFIALFIATSLFITMSPYEGIASTPRRSAGFNASTVKHPRKAQRRRRQSSRPKNMAVPVYSRVNTSDPVLFVTIDDGWHRDPRVVDFVHQHHIPVTVFLTEQAGDQSPSYFKEVASEGGSVQDHTLTHPFLNRMSYEKQRQQICGPLDRYESDYGHRPTLMRPPYGAYNQATGQATKDCGLRAMVMWSADMNNGSIATTGGHLRSGDIVLMHFRKDTYENLQLLSRLAAEAHLGFANLETYLVPKPAASEPAPGPGPQPGPQPSPSPSPSPLLPIPIPGLPIMAPANSHPLPR